MANVTVRNIPDEVHRALKQQAATHERSTEAEIRHILSQAVIPKDALMGDALLSIFAADGLSEAEANSINELRKTDEPVTPIAFD